MKSMNDGCSLWEQPFFFDAAHNMRHDAIAFSNYF